MGESDRPTFQTSIGRRRDTSLRHPRRSSLRPGPTAAEPCALSASRHRRPLRAGLAVAPQVLFQFLAPALAIATVFASSRKCGSRAASVARFCRLNASATSRAS